MHSILYLSEQHQRKQLNDLSDDLLLVLREDSYGKAFHNKADVPCFRLYKEEQAFLVDSNYFVGVDWLVPQKAVIYIEPKLNDRTQVDFLGMLLQSLEAPENLEHLEGLFQVDYEAPWISIPSQKDLLSPVLIIQFLKLVQKIVRKGLKKSYYVVEENLDSRVKGKIKVARQIKENIVKSRLTKTICRYQEYGVNTRENQFLKLVLNFVSAYLSQRQHFFTVAQQQQLQHILSYCLPAFQSVEELEQPHQRIHIKKNVFYKEYEEAIKVGGYILKRFSYNINRTSQEQTATPPFWIDMSKLFELYVYSQIRKVFPQPNAVSYHDSFWGGKETDILIREEGSKCVVDCKYKPQYKDHSPSLEDKRQLAGYVRLKSVYNKLDVQQHELIKGLIIYSHQEAPAQILKGELFKTEMGEYVKFYKLGIRLPELQNDVW